MKVSIPEALGISVLGIAVVFVVLVFLMCITYILAAIFKSRNAKKALEAVAVKGAATPAAAVNDVAQPISPQADAAVATTLAPQADSAGATIAPVAAPAIAPSATPAAATPAATTPAVAPAPSRTAALPQPVPSKTDTPYQRTTAHGGSGKYRVVIDGVDYSVDAEVDGALPATAAVASRRQTAASGGTGKFKVVINGVDYEVDAEVSQTGEGK